MRLLNNRKKHELHRRDGDVDGREGLGLANNRDRNVARHFGIDDDGTWDVMFHEHNSAWNEDRDDLPRTQEPWR